MSATKPLAHHANSVNPIRAATPFEQPPSHEAIVLLAVPTDAARPLIFPRNDGKGVTSLRMMRINGYPRLKLKPRNVQQAQIPGWRSFSGSRARYETIMYAIG